jgi:7-cyano-7-deazaguanine synthase
MTSVVLLSGGMDSTFAAVRTSKQFQPVAFLFIRYGQRGVGYEMAAAAQVAGWCIRRFDLHANLCINSIELGRMYTHPMGDGYASLDPDLKDEHGKPATFVPGRNLIMLSLAAGLAYELGATHIVGGWTQVDNDYPDCTADFLLSAQRTINTALGMPLGSIHIVAPLLRMSKTEEVREGKAMGVPFRLTRSCYGSEEEPCGECRSCLARARAFMANDLRDPLYPEKRWDYMKRRFDERNHGNPYT